jgi:hypothetical protein
MNKLLLIPALIFLLASCKKNNCGICTESLNGVIYPDLTREICSYKDENYKRESVEQFNLEYNTNWIVNCNR